MSVTYFFWNINRFLDRYRGTLLHWYFFANLSWYITTFLHWDIFANLSWDILTFLSGRIIESFALSFVLCVALSFGLYGALRFRFNVALLFIDCTAFLLNRCFVFSIKDSFAVLRRIWNKDENILRKPGLCQIDQIPVVGLPLGLALVGEKVEGSQQTFLSFWLQISCRSSPRILVYSLVSRETVFSFSLCSR